MTIVDTSMVVPALATWHVAHDLVRRAAKGAHVAAHARLETYSVLTRMPFPHRLDGSVVADLLDRWFPPDRIVVASTDLSVSIVDRCNRAGIEGGAVYDALVGLTGAEVGAELLTRDVRAARTYQLLGIAFRLIR